MLDTIDRMVERCAPVVRGGMRAFVGFVLVGTVIAAAHTCTGCASGEHAWVKPFTCTAARASVRLFCGPEDGSGGGLLDRMIDGHSGGEAHPDDPESGGLE